MSTTDANPADDSRWTVQRVLDWTAGHLESRGCDSPRLDAEILLAHARGCDRVQLYTQYAEELTADQRSRMRDLVPRRADRVPVAYLVGHREFFSLDFRVTPDVLIPRPDTETLVVELLERARGMQSPQILDVGVGSGCIAVAAAVNLPAARVTAIDVSEAALAVARENAETHGVANRVTFLHGDLFAPLDGDQRFDFVVSNPPYVADAEVDELEPEVSRHEPRLALVAGDDGLDVIRRLISEAPAHLNVGGCLMMEISPEQSEPVRDLLVQTSAFSDITVARDLARSDRAVIAMLG